MNNLTKKQDEDSAKTLNNPRYFIETFILMLTPLPFFDTYVKFHKGCPATYLYSQVIVAFMWLRLYFLVRCIMNYTCTYARAYSKYLCWSYGFASDTRFSIKCYIKRDPFKSILVLLFGTIFSLAYLLRIFELPNFSKDADSKSGL